MVSILSWENFVIRGFEMRVLRKAGQANNSNYTAIAARKSIGPLPSCC